MKQTNTGLAHDQECRPTGNKCRRRPEVQHAFQTPQRKAVQQWTGRCIGRLLVQCAYPSNSQSSLACPLPSDAHDGKTKNAEQDKQVHFFLLLLFQQATLIAALTQLRAIPLNIENTSIPKGPSTSLSELTRTSTQMAKSKWLQILCNV
eukprot:158581-Pelagomonas_calceolata.AAC.6